MRGSAAGALGSPVTQPNPGIAFEYLDASTLLIADELIVGAAALVLTARGPGVPKRVAAPAADRAR